MELTLTQELQYALNTLWFVLAGALVFIGAVGGVIVVASIVGLDALKIDDPVGAISVHGTAGIWGVLAVLLSTPDATLMGQLVGLGVIFGFVFATSAVLWYALKLSVGIRVTRDQEMEGVDLSECGIPAYPEFVTAPAAEGGAPGAGERGARVGATSTTAGGATA
jgi:ammonia channel protein AmtB